MYCCRRLCESSTSSHTSTHVDSPTSQTSSTSTPTSPTPPTSIKTTPNSMILITPPPLDSTIVTYKLDSLLNFISLHQSCNSSYSTKQQNIFNNLSTDTK